MVETAKANGLNVYQYFKHLLTEIPKHMDEKDMSFARIYFRGREVYRPSARRIDMQSRNNWINQKE